MGIVSSLIDSRSWHDQTTEAKLADYDDFLDYLLEGKGSAAGVNVTEKTAMKLGAVYACVKVISETIASLPLIIYRRLADDGKERAPKHNLYSILHDQPNPEMTSMEFRETIQGHILLWGNAYANIERDGQNYVKALWPLRPDRMGVYREQGELIYEYRLPSGEPRYFRPNRYDKIGNLVTAGNIWHMRGLGGNGIIGYSPIKQMKESIGLGMAAQEYGARLFSNDARPGGILVHPGTMDQKKYDNVKRSWQDAYGPLSQKHKVAILQEGMKWEQIGLPPESSQFLESRKFQAVDICGMYRVPPHKIGILDRATWGNIEHQAIEFVTDCLMPWLIRIEQSIKMNLMTKTDRLHHFPEHLVKGLLRGDTESRYKAYATGRQWGWMSANDVKRLENENPIPGKAGDVYLTPLNMINAESIAGMPLEIAPEGMRFLANRTRRSAAGRERIIGAYRRLFEDAAARIVRKEVLAGKRAADKYLKKGAIPDFNAWIDEFYADFPEFIRKNMFPVMASCAEEIQAACLDEMGIERSAALVRASQVYCTCEGKPVELETLVEHHEGALSLRYVSYSRSTIIKITERMASSSADDIAAEVVGILDEWDGTRAAKIASKEIIKANGLISRSTFFAEGAASVAWIAAKGESPFCKALDGKLVSKNEPFLRKGDQFQPEGMDAPLIVRNHRYHPPLVPGCECMVGI